MMIERRRAAQFGNALSAARALNLSGGLMTEELLACAYSKFVKPGDTVIDVGAHAGLHLGKLAALVGHTGRVIAVEPLPQFAERLRTENANNSAVTILETALSREGGKAAFQHVENGPGLSGLRAYDYPEVLIGAPAQRREIAVSVTTLDAITKDLPRVSYMKMDIEGGEVDALIGGADFIARHRPIISVEYGETSFKEYGHTADTLYDLALSHRYLLSDLMGNIIQSRSEWRECVALIADFFLVPAESARTWSEIVHQVR